MPMRETLDELTRIATALNSETDELNAVIEDIEDELQKAGVGLTAWLNWPIAESSWTEEYDQETDRSWEECTAWHLGYDKLADGWRLVVKRVKLRQDPGQEEPSIFDLPTPGAPKGEPLALAKAPRLVRMAAAGHLETLMKLLAAQMQRYLKNIVEAKKLVKS